MRGSPVRLCGCWDWAEGLGARFLVGGWVQGIGGGSGGALSIPNCPPPPGKYVGSRPIKLRKSMWKDRNIDVVRKKQREKKKLGLR